MTTKYDLIDRMSAAADASIAALAKLNAISSRPSNETDTFHRQEIERCQRDFEAARQNLENVIADFMATRESEKEDLNE